MRSLINRISWLFPLIFLLGNGPVTQLSEDSSGKSRVVDLQPPSPPRFLGNTLLASCEQSKYNYPNQNLCISLEKQKSYDPDKPIGFQLRWEPLPDGYSVVVFLNKLAIGSTNGAWGYPNREYIAFNTPIASFATLPDSGTIRRNWKVSGQYCTPMDDTGPICNDLTNIIRPSRYMLTAILIKGDASAYSSYTRWNASPADMPDVVMTATSRSFRMDGEHDWGRVDRDVQYAVRDYIKDTIGSESIANRHYKTAPLFELVDNKFEQQEDGLCGRYRLLDLLAGTLRVCIPSYYLTEYGLQPGRVDARLLAIAGNIKFAKGVLPFEKAKEIAARTAAKPYVSKVPHLSPPSMEQIGYVRERDGDYVKWLRNNPDAINYLELKLEGVSYLDEQGGFWIFHHRAKHINNSHIPHLSLPKTGFDDNVLVRVNNDGSHCMMLITPFKSKIVYRKGPKLLSCLPNGEM